MEGPPAPERVVDPLTLALMHRQAPNTLVTVHWVMTLNGKRVHYAYVVHAACLFDGNREPSLDPGDVVATGYAHEIDERCSCCVARTDGR